MCVYVSFKLTFYSYIEPGISFIELAMIHHHVSNVSQLTNITSIILPKTAKMALQCEIIKCNVKN